MQNEPKLETFMPEGAVILEPPQRGALVIPECELLWIEWSQTKELVRDLEPISPILEVPNLMEHRLTVRRAIAFQGRATSIETFIRRSGIWCGEARWLRTFALKSKSLQDLLTADLQTLKADTEWWDEIYYERIKAHLKVLELGFGMRPAPYKRLVSEL
ncbi:hypothetical protein HQ524_02240 [Candidatus Uhrbacteria bacterium]|nr:hypothetical protein [Candidatus Uhrbacteria bacterium]